ncbi:MAG: DUF2335 domain-containing protein [Desulfobulbus sp.]|jgi:uncharacterized membrane protein
MKPIKRKTEQTRSANEIPNPSPHQEEQNPKEQMSLEEQKLRLNLLEKLSNLLSDPAVLEQYEKVSPGLAKQIFAEFERRANHDRSMDAMRAKQEYEMKLLSAELELEKENIHTQRRGQWFGFIAVIIMATVALIALAMGHPFVAGSICSTTIAILAGVFVTGRRLASKEQTVKSSEGEG